MTRLKAIGENARQIEFWNGAAGDFWAGDTFTACQDRAQGPFGDVAMDALGLEPGHHVLDIGCGCGSTTFELSRRVGLAGHVLGVDISIPQLDKARQRAQSLGNTVVEFLNQDVATLSFEADSFDCAFSRFGVMFFARPIDAFANIRSGMKPGGRLSFSCWPTVGLNPWTDLTVQTARQHLPYAQPPGPEESGGFAFREPDQITHILSEAGFIGTQITLVDRAMTFEPDIAGTVEQLIQYGWIGPVIAQASEDIRDRIKTDLGEAIQGYQTANGVVIDGAAWIVSATCP